jgi:hypothetical protein
MCIGVQVFKVVSSSTAAVVFSTFSKRVLRLLARGSDGSREPEDPVWPLGGWPVEVVNSHRLEVEVEGQPLL